MNSPLSDAQQAPVNTAPLQKKHAQWLLLGAMVYLMLIAVSIIGNGFKTATGEHARALFEFAQNPILGLVIGMVATAAIQSSSTVTSIIVAMVAGGLPINIAIPMMMGANIGTSLTNTIVSLGHVKHPQEFQRAFNAATIHDFFNLFSVLIFLPLEIAFGVLEKLSGLCVKLFQVGQGASMGQFNPIKAITEPANLAADSLLMSVSPIVGGVIKIALGIALIITAITLMGKTMKRLMVGRAKTMLQHSIGKGPISGIASGTMVTVLVQSSSTTTSLVVPLVGNGVLAARAVYPFTLGANIGTTITAIIAALAVSGDMAVFALQIALVHFLYNLLGVLVIFGLPVLRNIPLDLSEWFSHKVAAKKIYGIGYITGVFFVLPLLAIFLLRGT